MSKRRAFRLTRGPAQDVDEEIAFHFESRIADLVREGLSPHDASAQAEKEFGDVSRVRAELTSSTRRRAARRGRSESARELWDDAAYVVRSVRRSPGFALTIALTLGLGIGGASTVFGVVDRLLLRGPAHVVAAADLRRVYAHVRSKSSGEFTSSSLPYAAYVALRDHARSITGAAAYAVNEARVGQGVDAVPVRLAIATADFFPLVGATPARGRFFTRAEDSPSDGTNVVVADYGYWTRQLGGADDAIGRVVTIAGKPFTVIGITQKGFTGADLQPVDLWVPVSSGPHPTADWPVTWRAQWLNVVVRVKPGMTAERVDADVTTVFRANYAGTEDVWKHADISARDISFTASGKPRDDAVVARWLGAVALLVLLIAAANAANLFIVRALRRQRDTAVRLALGISRGRMVRLLLLESGVCAILGCTAGVALTYAGGETMRRVLLPTIAWDAGAVSERPLIFALSVTVVIALAVGFAAIPQVLGTAVTPALHGTRRSQGARDSRTRRALLIAQMAMSVTLLIGAGLFVRSLINVDRLDLGVEADRVLVAAVGWPRPATPASTLADRARENNTWRQLRERIAHYPGVEHAALAIGSPFGSGFGVDVRVPGRDSLPAAPGGGPYISAVGPDYFRTTGTQIVGGRPFAPEDGPESARVAIVNQTMASLVWPNEDAIGKCIIVNDTGCAIVVGIARDARRNAIQEPASMQYYVPFGQETEIGGTVLLVRPVADARAFTQTLRGAILAEARGANFIKVTSMHDRIDPQVRPWRMGATMFTLFGALALVVAAVGLYGVIAYSTAQRTHEFGVRLAIGASSARMTRTVLAEALWIASVGVVVGGFAALIVAGRIAPLLFNVSPRDPFVFAIVALMLVCVALLASLVPALRAARVDPVIALRST